VRIDPAEFVRNLGQDGAQTPRLMLYILMAVVLMAMDQRGSYVPRLRAALAYAVEPVYHLVELPVRTLRGVRTYGRSYETLVVENTQQKETLLVQAGEMQRLAGLEEENSRLRALLEAAQGNDYRFQYAELVQVNLDPFSHLVVIDQGSGQGVYNGQAVIDGAGVMGQVESVQLHQSLVRLISDPDHALPVQILRTGQRSVAFGTGDPTRLLLPNLPMQSDLRVGDMLLTSGLGDRFPEGFPAAVVVEIERDPGSAFSRVVARPLAALDRGREVLLVLPRAEAQQP
jgi:rod shape-determining protein MreC